MAEIAHFVEQKPNVAHSISTATIEAAVRNLFKPSAEPVRLPISKVIKKKANKSSRGRRFSAYLAQIHTTAFPAEPTHSNNGDITRRVMYLGPNGEQLEFKFRNRIKKGIRSYVCCGCYALKRSLTIHVTRNCDYFIEDPLALKHVCGAVPDGNELAPVAREGDAEDHEDADLFAKAFIQSTTDAANLLNGAADTPDDIVDALEVSTAALHLSIKKEVPSGFRAGGYGQSTSTGVKRSRAACLWQGGIPPSIQMALKDLNPAFADEILHDILAFVHRDLSRKYGLRTETI